MADPVWLPQVLRDAGLQVREIAGWQNRGHGDFGNIWGVVCHHTGSNGASAESIAFHPSLGLASQLHLSRAGIYTMCGAGVAWHAGSGSWPSLPTNGANSYTIGIEAANDGGGSPGKPHRSSWPDVQYDAYVRGVAAILRKLKQDKGHAIGHKDWAGPAQGKWDPGAITMPTFRNDVAPLLLNPIDLGVFMALNDAEQREILQKVRELWDQLRGPGGKGWPQLGNKTPVDVLAELRDRKNA